MAVRKGGLGKGLDSMIPDKIGKTSKDQVETVKPDTMMDINKVEPNREQPRKNFDEDALLELSESIKQFGVIQPLIVQDRKTYYEIIAGERRWRAAKMAGLKEIPVIIKNYTEQEIMEISLIENIQREDLNAIEIALAYEHLMSNTGMTQERVSERVGKSRTAIANYLRLLKLPAQVQMALQKKEIDMGHARALLSIDSPSLQIKVFKEIQKNGYSVRKVEEIARQLNSGEDFTSAKKVIATKTQLPEEFNVLKDRLSSFFSTKVQMTCSPKGKGKISIPFSNADELEHIMAVLDKIKD